jgi:hypothetical protein
MCNRPIRKQNDQQGKTMKINSKHAMSCAVAALVGGLWLLSSLPILAQESPAPSTPADLNRLVNQPADIVSSAYQYRADRKADENPPESWLALMHYAKLPLNKPLDANAPAIKRVLWGLLWEEIRSVQQLELTWAANARRQPAPAELTVTTLNNKGAASSWWNNLIAVRQTLTPTVSADGKTYVYDLGRDTCGIVIGVAGDRIAANYDMPTVRALIPDVWKKMDVEIEWGFDPATAEQDYSGRVETYDGKLAALRSLEGDGLTTVTDATKWRSLGKSPQRRGVKLSLLYVGTSKWRKLQPFTTQPDDVARTIVTLWTKGGNFSFLAADLENGPILAPEYGFFVRRTSELVPRSPERTATNLRTPRIPLTSKMNSIAGNTALRGWGGDDDMPWFGGNPTDQPVSVQGIAFPAKSLAMHPGPDLDVAVGWRSPIKGLVKVSASTAHTQAGGNGVEWSIVRETQTERKILVHGATNGTGSRSIPGEGDQKALSEIAVEPGDMLSLIIGPNGDYRSDTNIIELTIAEVGGSRRVWGLTPEVVESIHANPHSDGQGNAVVWHFYSVRPRATAEPVPSQPPIDLASKAVTAREFIRELQDRKLSTIRARTRIHEEQTWEGAVTKMNGAALPPHPAAPAGFEPAMQVHVPSERLTAQWNLGVWHLSRHAQRNPKNGRMWFNDFPYGILGAETYMVLAVLDKMGSHQAAADGYDQWVSLPMDPNSAGHHPDALPDRPVGLFSEGHGCLTHAVGPDGLGGQMDGVHSFGPGSISLSLTEHYWLTGDLEWLKASAPRIKANAEWMLRQRRLMSSVVPGGGHLWCKGLQPAPDSGGLWMQFYECEAYYWASVSRFATVLSAIDPTEGAKLMAEAEAYRNDLRAAVERSIALSPVVPLRDGTFHSVIPFACYVRGLSTGAWGWLRDGSAWHVGPLYWETVQSAAALISPAELLPANDVRVQGYLDVLEDRLLLENAYVGQRCNGDWFSAGWQYQGGLERTPNMHLAGDDIPVFLRSFLNCYAVDILPQAGYVFNEHAVHGPPDKIFEEAAFLERFRNLLVMEDGQNLWLARGTPRAWLEQGKKIAIEHAPTHFGATDCEIVSDVDHGTISATVKMPSRNTAKEVWLRLRHPKSTPMKSVSVNGKPWNDFDPAKEIVRLHDLKNRVNLKVNY